MGRRLNTTQSVVIQTELTPLSDMFSISPSDTLEQWYYVNGGIFSPNRANSPLVLTPSIRATDLDTGTNYTPSLAPVNWYYFDKNDTVDRRATDALWPGLGWVPITNTNTQSDADYIKDGQRLIVHKNVAPPTTSSNGARLCCVARYIDPRDSGVTYTVMDDVTLTTNQDASTDFFDVYIQTPKLQTFNPFVRYNLTPNPNNNNQPTRVDVLYKFPVKVLNKSNNADITSNFTLTWYGVNEELGEPMLIERFPCYKNASQVVDSVEKGQGTDTVVINAMYIEEITIICKISYNGNELDPYDQVSLSWEYPKIDPIADCINGKSVDNNNRSMKFGTIINTKDGELSKEQKETHLLINWKKQASTAGQPTYIGYGQEITVSSNELKQTTSYVTNVSADIYMLGVFDVVEDSNETVTDNGETVYDRYCDTTN